MVPNFLTYLSMILMQRNLLPVGGARCNQSRCKRDPVYTRKSSCVNARGIPPAGGPVILVEVVNKEKIV